MKYFALFDRHDPVYKSYTISIRVAIVTLVDYVDHHHGTHTHERRLQSSGLTVPGSKNQEQQQQLPSSVARFVCGIASLY